MESERWAPVPGCDGIEASDFGRVRFYGEIARQTESGGYLVVRDKRRKRQVRVHRLVLRAFVGECPSGMETRHINGDGHDNRLENLAWGTAQENAADRRAHEEQRENGLIPPSRLAGRCVSVAPDLADAIDVFADADSRTRSNAAQYLMQLGLETPKAQAILAKAASRAG